ncbi:hypothetical protein LXL04_026283 [Taraxacum kok-saghyz]
MSDLYLKIPTAFANAEDSGVRSKEYPHIRVQQRNGRKSLTIVEGISFKVIQRADDEYGIITLQYTEKGTL